MSAFTHLHVHTQYSILDGAAPITKLLKRTKDLGMDALAITDHGSMFGAFDFQRQAEKAGIKPIIGCEFYVAKESRLLRQGKEDQSSYHLILLAKNSQGYQNLCRLNSLAYREGYYYKPRIDKELMRRYHDGIIACSACLGGEIPRLLLSGMNEAAEQAILEHRDIFGDDYYLELQNHGLDDQRFVNERLKVLGAKHGIKLIASNDLHFVEADDFEMHHILVCLNIGKKLSDDTKMSYTGQEYLKSPSQMIELFSDCPEAISNTQEIVDKIESFQIKRPTILPKFPLPEGFDSEMAYLRHLTHVGAVDRWGDSYDQAIRDRLEFELQTVEKMGFPGYFLIVWDFIRAAREMGVLVGPGRGSAAGSAIAYAIRITNVDPIKYHLLFERFLNPDRISMPDVDIDFDDAGRERVIRYVVDKYGSERVAQIITFGSMASKSAIKDVARVLDLPLSESDRLTKLIPDKVKNLTEAMQQEPLLKQEYESGLPLIRKTIGLAVALEGSLRSTGTHACGMIIAPEDLQDIVPLSMSKNTDMPVVQYEGTLVEDAGLLKMDFLGLSTLNIIKNSIENIRLRHGILLDIDQIPLDDSNTYELFSRGETMAIFQFESEGMRTHLMNLKPNRLEDLIAMNALYRPGPMEKIPNYIRRKFGTEQIQYDLPGMELHLNETYGITVYQEQVMLLSQTLAGFTKGDADTLRKAMGKKQIETLNKLQPKFIEGCQARGHDSKICEKIWHEWEAFASYAFNKSHATCYAYIAYQTAYLKANYPAEYMAASLTNDLNDISKISLLMDECRRMRISLLGPDINESQVNFTVNHKNEIRFGMAAVKGVGVGAVEAILEAKEQSGPFRDLFDFISRVDLRRINKRCVESLVKAGVFDSISGVHRAQFFYQKPGSDQTFLDHLMQYGTHVQKIDNSAQMSMFSDSEDDLLMTPVIPTCEPWPSLIRLRAEKEVTGFYLSGHPLDLYRLEQEQFTNCQISQFKEHEAQWENRSVSFAGVVVSASHLLNKKGLGYGRMIVEDFDSQYEISLYKDDYNKYRHHMVAEAALMISGLFKSPFYQAEKKVEFRVSAIESLDNYLNEHAHTIQLTYDITEVCPSLIELLTHACKAHKGTCRLAIQLIHREQNQAITLPSLDKKVSAETFLEELRRGSFPLRIKLS